MAMVHVTYQRIGLYGAVAAVVVTGLVVAFSSVRDERKAVHIPAPKAAPQPTPIEEPRRDDMREIIAAVKGDELRTALDQIYAAVEYRPLWSGSRAASRRMNDFEDALSDVARQGVDVSRADAARVAAVVARNDASLTADLALTEHVLRIARGLRGGFTEVTDWYIPADDVDVTAEVAGAVDKGEIRQLFRALAPAHTQYRGLMTALADYGAMHEKGGWPTVDAGPEVKIGTHDSRIAQLRARLAAEGYLPAHGAVRDAELVDAVKAFQVRNGLTPDGRVGAGTLKALNASIEDRIDQIVANLERWRHMPRALEARHVAVNVADHTLAIMEEGEAVWTTRTIAGARRTSTPMLKADITGVTLNPYWEIPPSIATKEILPKLKRDPYYLASHDMVIADDISGDPHGTQINWSRYSANSFPYRLRQRPGTGNSLGLLKFNMATKFNIYLHDTPSRDLFARDDRYLSHGCVRVQNPSELASRVLGRDAAALDEQIATGETKTIALNKRVPVYVMYWTTFSDQDGTLHFREDAYGRDRPTVVALGFSDKNKPAQVVSREEDALP